ncbi:hypothetical protein ANTRET_LOCUS10078 [Anthophora retusa]
MISNAISLVSFKNKTRCSISNNDRFRIYDRKCVQISNRIAVNDSIQMIQKSSINNNNDVCFEQLILYGQQYRQSEALTYIYEFLFHFYDMNNSKGLNISFLRPSNF